MSWRLLKIQAFVVAATLSIAMLLFAAQRHEVPAAQFRAVVDLTASSAANVDLSRSHDTLLVAPAKVGGAWTVDTLPAARLTGPLVVIEAQHKRFPDSESLVTMDDVASYERLHGAVPRGAIVLLASTKQNGVPLLNDDALRFLGEARDIVGIGTSANQTVSPQENPYLAAKGIYQLLNVTNISLVPRSGAIAIAAPQKIAGASEERSRVLALAR